MKKLFKKIKKLLTLTVILVVVILAAVLIFWTFKNKIFTTPIASPTPRPPWVDIFASPPEISSVEELFSYDPGADASPEDVVEYVFLVSREAVSTNSVSLSSCLPEPAVVRVLTGTTLRFKNNDSQSHRLSGSDWNVEVPANDATSFDVAVSGVHKYTCDGQPVGVLFVPY